MKTYAEQLLIGLSAIGIGAFVLTQIIRGIRRVSSAKDWPHTKGVLTKATTEGHWTWIGGGRAWIEAPDISYTYEVEGSHFVGHDLALVEVDSCSKQDAEDKIRNLTVGKEVIVYFDPKDPTTSALDVTVKPAIIARVLCIVCVVPIVFGVLVLTGVIEF
jgi:hypothetical protein